METANCCRSARREDAGVSHAVAVIDVEPPLEEFARHFAQDVRPY